jgi:uncharacterized protein (TIGR03382 family)
MRRFAKLVLPVVAVAALLIVLDPSSLWAGTPEIDPSSGTAALALLAGAVLVIRGRFKK